MKHYIKPEIEVFDCQLKQPIAFSVNYSNDDDESLNIGNEQWDGNFN